MAMKCLAGSWSKIDANFSDSFIVLQYPIKISRQELMAGTNGFYLFNVL